MAEEYPGGERTVYRSQVPLHIRKLTQRERDELVDLATKRAPDPSIFDEGGVDPFFFQTRASNNKLDSYFTWMADSSLKNYAEDATDPGVQFQVSHNGAGGGFFGGPAGEVGFGRSLKGEILGPKTDRACLIDFYTVPGLECGNMTSDQFIMGARSGIYADVSIGFTPGSMICSICDNDFLKKYDVAWDDPTRCEHWPGMTYAVEKGRKIEEILCTLRVEDGHLNEVSTVYDGATPGAGIVAVDMARIAASHGQLQNAEAQLLENIYRVRINQNQMWALGEVPIVAGTSKTTAPPVVTDPITDPKSEAAVTVSAEAAPQSPSGTATEGPVTTVRLRSKNAAKTESNDPLDFLRTKYAESGLDLEGNDPIRMIEALADLVLIQTDDITRLEREAGDGRQFREGLLVRLDESVVRAFGGDGADERKARYRKMAESLDVAGIEELIADNEHRAGERFQGGRTTRDAVDGDEPDPSTERRPRRNGPTRSDLTGV